MAQMRKITYDPAAQTLPFGTPEITLQYVPAGRPLWNVAAQAESWLFIATKATWPRAKAICCELGETQFVSAFDEVDMTVLRKPTIPAMADQRCWQSQPFVPPLLLHVPAPGAAKRDFSMLSRPW